jgi:hypothetical protein
MSRRVLFISPGFPLEMPRFVAGLAAWGAEVIGVGDQPVEALAPATRNALAGYVRVPSMGHEEGIVEVLRERSGELRPDAVECLWEPGVLLAARIREALDLPGMRVEQARCFRDKERMKQALDAAGIRTPRHRRAASEEACHAAAEEIGFPLIVKPIAGAGSADTHRVESPEELARVLPLVRHVAEVSVEEYIDGEEYTFDTICADGRVLYHNVSWYRPRPLIGRSVEWISPQTVCLRDPARGDLAGGVALGHAVLAALGFREGFTHMEWFRSSRGEAVFGEIAARPPGALSVDLMNYASDLDTYVGWAEAVLEGRLSQPIERRYNAAVVFKRARGTGRIQRVEGLAALLERYRASIVSVDLLPVGAPRRNWKQTLLSDGHVIVRHPDLAPTLEMADRIGVELQLIAEG